MKTQASTNFDKFFEEATENSPFAFQKKFAEACPLPELISVPTGLGKTAMVVIGWLWRHFGANERLKLGTPRRLVYCLPMRVLVEQTDKNTRQWIGNLKAAGLLTNEGPAVHVLMGGEDETDWDIQPEREAILIGTQDMLLSRALNRGYGASRARWPMQFGLLHTDCLWVFDEVQLMGAGLATTAQLEAFRSELGSEGGHGCRSVWMSATLDRHWLKTVDFAPYLDSALDLEFDFAKEINAAGLDGKARGTLNARWTAEKPLAKGKARCDKASNLASEVLEAHKAATRTIVVVNTVKRARDLFNALKSAVSGDKASSSKRQKRIRSNPNPGAAMPNLVLLHSRFRPADRTCQLEQALAQVAADSPGTIVVSTQVIEAGVDVSATTLFTELAPWSSLMQRLGRCNRWGEANKCASVRWIDVDVAEAAPYDESDLRVARETLEKLEQGGVSLERLYAYIKSLTEPERKELFRFEHRQVIRKKDFVDLFDTTPDLAGNDIDIDRYVREVEESDVRVFWRDYHDMPNATDDKEGEPAPRREELCPVPISEFRNFAKDNERKEMLWRWNFLDKKWERARPQEIVPGQVFLVHAKAGGYSPEQGWNPSRKDPVEPIRANAGDAPPDAYDDERLSRLGVWQTIAQHSNEVSKELEDIVRALSIGECDAEVLRHAARWHDRGKAHEVFQKALPASLPDSAELWAKAKEKLGSYSRPHFRHELASALAVLDPHNGCIPSQLRDRVAYLVAAHHGRVRLSIRSLPNEKKPPPDHGNTAGRRFARGIWDGDVLPRTDLGGGVIAPEVSLSLEPMELGLCEEPPFTGQPSWAERMLRLRNELGPFRLAYLEALLRAADMRASRAAEQCEAEPVKP